MMLSVFSLLGRVQASARLQNPEVFRVRRHEISPRWSLTVVECESQCKGRQQNAWKKNYRKYPLTLSTTTISKTAFEKRADFTGSGWTSWELFIIYLGPVKATVLANLLQCWVAKRAARVSLKLSRVSLSQHTRHWLMDGFFFYYLNSSVDFSACSWSFKGA